VIGLLNCLVFAIGCISKTLGPKWWQ
jgi:hypothetical protein